MSRIVSSLTIFFLGALTLFSVYANSEILFEDGFESGDVSHTSNNIRWKPMPNNRVTDAAALSGDYSLFFRFRGVPSGQDSSSEQRIDLGGEHTELWIKYDLYIPNNYYHRRDGASNNKFFAIFNNGYRPGFQVNFSLNPGSNGGSTISVHYYQNGREQSSISAGTLFTPSDFGKWHRIVLHFKVPSTLTSSDGIQQLWKNGTNIVNITNLGSNGTQGLNYMDEAYILGWANSGFDEETMLYVDNFVIADTPISPNGAPGPATPPNIILRPVTP